MSTAAATLMVVVMVVTAATFMVVSAATFMVMSATAFAVITATTATLAAEVVQHVLYFFHRGLAVFEHKSREL